MRNGFFIFSVALLAVALHDGLRAAEPKVLLSSQVATNGDFLTLPVKIEGKQYSFAVDTGSSYSSLNKTFLESLERYDPAEKPIEELDGLWSQTYLAPAMTICGTESGSLRFPQYALITCFDMTDIQQASDQQIDGILGMDFLAPYALELDLSIGTLRLLDSQTLTETQYDGRIPTQLSPDRRPCITGEANGETFLALVDTGAYLSLHLQQKHHALLCEQKKLVPWQVELLIDGQKQVRESHQGTLQELTIGPFTHRQLVAKVDEDISLVGLMYWKRYKATFDFPRGWIYLKKNACFAMRDCSDHAGLWIESDAEDSKIKIVQYITQPSDAAGQGVQIGDRLLSINGQDLEDASPQNIYRRLSDRYQRTCELRFERAGKPFVITLPALGNMPVVQEADEGEEPGKSASER